MPDEVVRATRQKRNEFIGAGCFLQGLGLLAPILLGALLSVTGVVIGLVLLVVLFIAGSSKSTKWVCGNCKNPIASKEVTVCPACRAQLGEPDEWAGQ